LHRRVVIANDGDKLIPRSTVEIGIARHGVSL
jgi:hypothetical protein